jgi:hypothetical protein
MKKLIDSEYKNAKSRLSGYEIIVAAGDNNGIKGETIDIVKKAIIKSPTITLSCGKLLTGVTVREWDGIFMLTNIHSAERYWQAAFRVQSPYAIRDEDKKQLVAKPQSFVFDYDLGRLLEVVAGKAYAQLKAAGKKESSENTQKIIDDHLHFSPVITNTKLGLVELKANNVLDIIARNFSNAGLLERWTKKHIIGIEAGKADILFKDKKILEMFKTLDGLVNKGAHKKLFEAFEGSAVVDKGTGKKSAKSSTSGVSGTKDGIDEKELAKLYEILRSFIPRLMLYVYMSNIGEKKIEDIVGNPDKDVFNPVTRLTIPVFKKVMEAGIYDNRDIDREILFFSNSIESSKNWWGST